MKLIGRRFWTDKRSFYTQHLISLWDLLSHDVVVAATWDGFTKGRNKVIDLPMTNSHALSLILQQDAFEYQLREAMVENKYGLVLWCVGFPEAAGGPVWETGC